MTPAPEDRGRALIVGDDDLSAVIPDEILNDLGFIPVRVTSVDDAKRICDEVDVDLIVMSLWIGDESLLPALTTCMDRSHPPAVVVIARHDQINDAATAMRGGAEDCLFLPFSESRLERTLRNALARRGGSTQPPPLAPSPSTLQTRPFRPTDTPSTFHGLIGRSPAMRALFDKIRAISTSEAPVLITGEVGTGRTSLARALHNASPRASGPFVAVDCARLDGTECLTRIEPGAADAQSEIARASGGTLFLDRLDAFDNRAQMRLLALVQELEASALPDRPRLVASLSAPAAELVDNGLLREDLYFALNVIELVLPPLRMRREDLPFLLESTLARVAAREDRALPLLTAAARRSLLSYDWPGNLRELENVLRGLVLTAGGLRVTAENLPVALVTDRAQARLSAGRSEQNPARSPTGSVAGLGALLGQRLADIERAVIEATIAAEDGSIPRAARVLDVSPSTIYRKREGWTEDEDP
nr:sigma 54-interacting transcriptional regulator [Maritimibacter dapengensis]